MMLRRATQTDVKGLTDCFAAAYATFQKLGLPPVTDGIADDIRNHNVWVAVVDGVIRGGIVLVLGSHAHVANLGVHPDAGRHGIGRALIDRATDAAAAAGRTEIRLATHVDMAATQAFYRKCGWSETGREANKVYFALKLV